MFPLVNLTKVSTAAHSMYFPKSQFQLGSPPILVTASELCRVIVPFSPPANAESCGSRGLLVVFLLLPKSPSGPPWNEGHQPKVCHKTSPFEVPAQERHEHSFTLVLLIHLLQVLCTQVSHITGCSRPQVEVRLTPKQYTEWNVAGRAHSTGDPS